MDTVTRLKGEVVDVRFKRRFRRRSMQRGLVMLDVDGMSKKRLSLVDYTDEDWERWSTPRRAFNATLRVLVAIAWVPIWAAREIFWMAGKTHYAEDITVTELGGLTRIVIGANAEAERPGWPEGSLLGEIRRGAHVRVRGGGEEVPDVLIFDKRPLLMLRITTWK